MTIRLPRGSLPWPAPPASGPVTARPVCRGSLTVEAPITPGTRLRITAWPRSAPDPSGGRKTTAHNPPSQRPPNGGTDMTSERKRAALAALNEVLWEIDTADDPMVVVAALVEHAVGIATGQWEPEHVRTVIAELVDAALVEMEGVP
jgi:hypothetical protein